MANYPELTYRFPTLNSGNQTDPRPEIVLDWSADMETTQFSDPSQRAANIVLMEDGVSVVIATDFVSYIPSSRRVTLQPSVNLKSGTTYRILIKNKLASTDSRKSFNEYNWTFQTSDSVVPVVSLLTPGDASIQPVFPTLTWSSITATGTITYTVQIDERWDFGSVAYRASTMSTSLTPAGTFDESTTYYWRVQASTSAGSGNWSDVRSFFYGRAIDSDASSRQNFPDPGIFVIKGTSFKNGLSNQTAFPTIKINFSSQVASDYASYITITAKHVLPRNDIASTYVDVPLNGTWSQSGNVLTFTPTDAISNNMRYEIYVSSGLTDVIGYQLGRDVTYYWTSKYDPYYVHLREVRSRFLGAEQQIPDDLINFYIHISSLEANARYYGYMMNPTLDMIGDTLQENMVRDNAHLNSHGVLKWVAANATYKMLRAILLENLRDIGRTEKVGDAEMALSADFVKGMTAAMDDAKQELAQWESYLIPSDIPVSVGKSSGWSPRNWDYDYSVGGHEASRDDWFEGGGWSGVRGWGDHR